jgi:hypothetical protein
MNARILASAAAAALLAACGSKSGGEAPPTGPNVRYTGSLDAVSLTSAMSPYAVAGGAAGVGGGFGDVSGAGGVASPSGVAVGELVQPRPATIRNAFLMAQDALERHGPAIASGAFVSVSRACARGGTATITGRQQVQNQTSANDFVQVSFVACEDADGNRGFGSFRMTILETNGDDFVADVKSITTSERFGLRFAFSDFATVDPAGAWTGVDGALDVSFVATVDSFDPVAGGTGSLEFAISGARLVSASGPSIGRVSQATALLPVGADPTFHELGRELYTGMGRSSPARTESQFDLDARVCTLERGGCVNFLTAPIFQKLESDLHPYVGALEVFDDHLPKHFVKVTALSATDVEVQWDFGDQTGLVDTTWSCLDGTATCP